MPSIPGHGRGTPTQNPPGPVRQLGESEESRSKGSTNVATMSPLTLEMSVAGITNRSPHLFPIESGLGLRSPLHPALEQPFPTDPSWQKR